jgi:hypothetical protein
MADDPQQISTMVVRRDATVPTTTVGVTPTGVSDVVLRAVSPLWVIFIRSARVFIQALLAGLSASNLSTYVGIHNFDFHAVLVVAGMTAGMTALQNAGELLAKLDQTAPQFRG